MAVPSRHPVPPAEQFAVPTISLTASSPSAVVEALMSHSCAFVVDHGVDAALLRDMVAVSTEYFELPRDEKLRTRWPGEGLWRGWQPVYEGAADLTGDRVPDLLERFEVQLAGRRADDDASLAALRDSFGLWPERPARFSAVWTRYYAALGGLANRLMERIVSHLELQPEALAAWTEEHHANLVAVNYIAQETPPQPGQLRIRTHTDRGGLTLLWADQSPGGLEVMLPHSREWVPVLIPADAFLVQAGELLSRWTSWVIRPNIHRVVNPPAEFASSRRISVPYFHYPRLDAVVEPAPSCVAVSPRTFSPVVAGEFTRLRQDAYAAEEAEGVDLALENA